MNSRSVATHFWKWFKLHNSRFINIYKLGTKTSFNYQIMELLVHVRSYSKWLSADITVDEKTATGILVITANGRQQGFKAAKKLVACAPQMANWTFFALRPANPIGEFALPVENTSGIELYNCWFESFTSKWDDRKLIDVYVDFILPGKEREVERYVEDLIENLLGEELKRLHINLWQIYPRCDAHPDAQLQKLETLPALIRRSHPDFMIGKDGKIEGG